MARATDIAADFVFDSGAFAHGGTIAPHLLLSALHLIGPWAA
ncbi:hypothetical protein HYPP_01227 [Hyphomicrobium sp. ghe19]|nr:hypothetical protein HYPP_01227 [Hyphomicrobium sp. ghe19]